MTEPTERYRLILGDCIEKMREMPENSVDSIVTDPPYGLEFMGKEWDTFKAEGGERKFNDVWAKGSIVKNAPAFRRVPIEDKIEFQEWTRKWAGEALRVLKPGGHIIAFGGSRMYHRLACAIEDAGFEVRDQMMWIYGSGFPKSHNVANDIDKRMGHPARGRAIPMASTHFPTGKYAEEKLTSNKVEAYEPRSEEAKPWNGWGTALKPAHEPMVLGRKPIAGTVAANVLKWGTGAMNIDACRVEADGENFDHVQDRKDLTGKCTHHHEGGNAEALAKLKELGRFPANVMHDGSEAVLQIFPETGKSQGGRCVNISKTSEIYGGGNGLGQDVSAEDAKGDPGYGDSGSAARFFYCAKASKKDRNEGCDGLPTKAKIFNGHSDTAEGRKIGGVVDKFCTNPSSNFHPTVKPTELMRYLCRLVTPPNGTVLDPFNGSGSTGKAAMLEGFDYIGIEMNPEYIQIAKARIEAVLK